MLGASSSLEQGGRWPLLPAQAVSNTAGAQAAKQQMPPPGAGANTEPDPSQVGPIRPIIYQIIRNCPDPGQSHSLPRALGSGGSCEALALWGCVPPWEPHAS